jgi:predicted metal-dependent HD superfamily phosphohydrolase
MFEQTFKIQLASLTGDQMLIDEFWSEIKSHYSKSNRHYHNLSHLDNLELELLPVKDNIRDWQTLVFSIGYHDIIYNIRRNDNEEKSADFAANRLSKLSISSFKRQKCLSQIIATKSHMISDDDDTNYFVDADLSILGANRNEYSRYVKMIRKEYNFYPDFMYKPGRQKVLQHFIQMPRIYKTDYFHDRYEEKARDNLHVELKELSS